MESLILSQNTCWKQKIGYKMSGTLRGEIWGLSFAVAHSVTLCKSLVFLRDVNYCRNITLAKISPAHNTTSYLHKKLVKYYYLYATYLLIFYYLSTHLLWPNSAHSYLHKTHQLPIPEWTLNNTFVKWDIYKMFLFYIRFWWNLVKL